MKRVIFTLLVIAAGSIPASAKYSGGSGDPNTPYQIANAADLFTLANEVNDYNKCFIMTADINLDPNLPGGRVFTTGVIGPAAFIGVFNGNGHKIVNLTINTSGAGTDDLGLFRQVGVGEVKNLGLENISITGGSDSWTLGGLAGYNRGIINNCFSMGTVAGGNSTFSIGGLVGSNNGYINNSFSTCSVRTGNDSYYAGGLAGNSTGVITDCFSTGSVTGGDYIQVFGGLVGLTSFGSISNCYSTGAVTGGDWAFIIGGFTGALGEMSEPNISNCYSTSDVNVGNYTSTLGGFIGICQGDISNCYSTGDVNFGSEPYGGIGGFAGSINFGGDIVGSYYLVSAGPDNDLGIPLSDSQMKQQSSFVGWDFVWEPINGTEDIWAICEGASYPKLAWQFVAGDSDNDKDVDFIDFAAMGNKWMQVDSNLYCGGSDLTGDGLVNWDDLAALAENWLQGL